MNASTPLKLSSVITAVQAQPLTDPAAVDITGCYISDLLSDVLAHAQPGMLWVTLQTHRNVISTASMKDISAVLFTTGRKPAPAIIAEAEVGNITLLTTPLTTYEAAGRLWEAGLR